MQSLYIISGVKIIYFIRKNIYEKIIGNLSKNNWEKVYANILCEIVMFLNALNGDYINTIFIEIEKSNVSINSSDAFEMMMAQVEYLKKRDLIYFSSIYKLILEQTEENILLIIDEIDAFLHPKWQQDIVTYIIRWINEG